MEGNECPETLGEYRDLCAALTTEDNPAVQFLDRKIAACAKGRAEKVIASDVEMRMILMPLMAKGLEEDGLRSAH